MRWFAFVVVGALACGREEPPPRSVAVPTVSATADSPEPVASTAPLASATEEDPMKAGSGDVEPVDRGVLASADQALVKSATERARACLAAHEGPLQLRVKVTLADDGTPSADLRAADEALTAAQAKCVLEALARGRYTKPGTPVGPAVTKRFFTVHVEVGVEPREFQVD